MQRQALGVRMVVLAGLSCFLACKQAPPPPSPPAPAAPEPAIETAPEPPKAPPEPPPPIVIGDVGFETPESVLHDELADHYLVSNIKGDPLTKDGNGFISIVATDGSVKQLKFIEGGANKVTLNAPKGMGILNETLYVADIDTVRMFDRTSGAPKGEIKVKGATFLNDVAVLDDTIFVTDTGMKAGFKPSGSDAVLAIKDGKAKPLVKNKALAGPNGMVAHGDMLWVVNFGGKTLQMVDLEDGKLSGAVELPAGQLDGVGMLHDGSFVVSSWEANAVFRGRPGQDFETIVKDVASPADFGIDVQRNRLIIPLFTKNVVEIHTLGVGD